ncbi:hypothetical protein PoB_002989600 [Plakobranchus ocellatus]|uniref:Uncharacterized protein n=1 Tax=Plakobranchus ocellatus TaxID=259542 RepID=A0AAV4A9N7_9GAST|nr:hypothetical protein PoB_002989600 [Plakobranchus ocellatus]
MSVGEGKASESTLSYVSNFLLLGQVRAGDGHPGLRKARRSSCCRRALCKNPKQEEPKFLAVKSLHVENAVCCSLAWGHRLNAWDGCVDGPDIVLGLRPESIEGRRWHSGKRVHPEIYRDSSVAGSRPGLTGV